MLAPLVLGSFAITLLNYIGISALAALGLVLLTGIGGMTSFGQAAFVGIAAYATAWATTTEGLSPWLGLLLALASTGIAALAIGALTLRLDGHFLSLSTIAWGISIYFLFGNVAGLGQNTGMSGIPPIAIGSVPLISSQTIFYLIWLMVGLAMLASANLLNSREGRAIRSLRGGGVLLASLGVNIFRIRLVTFVIAALLAGLAGWLYAHMNRFVSPAPFDVKPGIEYLLMAMAGGAGHIAGAVAGSALITLLQNWLQDVLPLMTHNPAQFEIIVFSILLILLLQNARGGLIAFVLNALPQGLRPPPAAAEPMTRRALPEGGTAILKVENAVRTFGGLTAVNKVSFELKAGEILGLIGPNGAGKSTMFNLLTGALQANSGRISFLGQDITRRPQTAIARMGIARTFQHVKLRPNMSLIDNVALGAYARTATGFLKSALRLDRAEERRTLHETQRQLQRVGLGDKPLRTRRQSAAGRPAHPRSRARAGRRSGAGRAGRAGRGPAAAGEGSAGAGAAPDPRRRGHDPDRRARHGFRHGAGRPSGRDGVRLQARRRRSGRGPRRSEGAGSLSRRRRYERDARDQRTFTSPTARSRPCAACRCRCKRGRSSR